MQFSVAHLDADCFFVQVARLADPSLERRAVAVGMDGPRGVIASASYEARAFGVHSAMPVGVARRHCPELIVVGVDRATVGLRSAMIWDAVRACGLPFEQAGVDEGYLDVSSVGGDGLGAPAWAPVRAVERIRRHVRATCGMVISAGVSTGRVSAKIASARAKPDGLLAVPGDEVVSFLAPLPVSALPGVGPVAERKLASCAIRTVGDLAEIDVVVLASAVGRDVAERLVAWAHGQRLGGVEVQARAAQSISAEETLTTNTTDPAVVSAVVERLCAQVAGRLFQAGLGTSAITVKVRSPDFKDRSATVQVPSTDDWGVLVDAARRALERVGRRDAIRLVGVSAGRLAPGIQPSLLDVGLTTASPPDGRIAPGVSVTHPVFGLGIVERAAGADGDVTVRFKDRTRVIERARLTPTRR